MRVRRTTPGQPPMRAIILLGFMGAGKSSVGRAIALRLGWTFADLDDRIERRERRTVGEIFRDDGEKGFRGLEHTALRELLDEVANGAPCVIALGGGTYVYGPCAQLIAASNIPAIFLDADVDELWSRCIRQAQAEAVKRPMLVDTQGFRELYEKRRPHYLKAEWRHETGGKAVDDIATELIAILGLSR